MGIRIQHEPAAGIIGRVAYGVGAGKAAKERRDKEEERQYQRQMQAQEQAYRKQMTEADRAFQREIKKEGLEGEVEKARWKSAEAGAARQFEAEKLQAAAIQENEIRRQQENTRVQELVDSIKDPADRTTWNKLNNNYRAIQRDQSLSPVERQMAMAETNDERQAFLSEIHAKRTTQMPEGKFFRDETTGKMMRMGAGQNAEEAEWWYKNKNSDEKNALAAANLDLQKVRAQNEREIAELKAGKTLEKERETKIEKYDAQINSLADNLEDAKIYYEKEKVAGNKPVAAMYKQRIDRLSQRLGAAQRDKRAYVAPANAEIMPAEQPAAPPAQASATAPINKEKWVPEAKQGAQKIAAIEEQFTKAGNTLGYLSFRKILDKWKAEYRQTASGDYEAKNKQLFELLAHWDEVARQPARKK